MEISFKTMLKSKTSVEKLKLKHERTYHKRRRRTLLRYILYVFILIAVYYTYTHAFVTRFPRDVIARTKPLSKLVTHRYILFTTPVDDGQWPALFDTRSHLIHGDNSTTPKLQVYTKIPRNVGLRPRLDDTDLVYAMVADSQYVLATDFPPLQYLKNSGTKLIVQLSPNDRGDAKAIEAHLLSQGVQSYVVRLGSDDPSQRKLELLSLLSELQTVLNVNYFVLVEQTTMVMSTRTLMHVLSRYNPIESHTITDDSGGVIVLTKSILARIFESGVWERCVASQEGTGNERILRCIGLAQGLGTAKLDIEALSYRSVNGSNAGLLEQSQRLAVNPGTIEGDKDAVWGLLSHRSVIKRDELFASYAFYEHDQLAMVYHHGYSITFPHVRERDLTVPEQTWDNRELEPGHRTATSERLFLRRWEQFVEHTKEGKIAWVAMEFTDGKRSVQVDWV